MNNSTANQAHPFDVVRITELENTGIHSTTLSRIAIGYIISGKKYIYNNDQYHPFDEGSVFILDKGLHYEENCIGSNGRFEQIIFYISSNTLQEIIFGLNINYGISFHSHHNCNHCLAYNFASTKADTLLRNFFVGIELSLRNSALLHNDIGQRIKLNELIYLLLSGEDNCTKRKILRAADTSSGQFVSTIYNNIFNDISIEQLAEQTNRSLTSFKKEFRRIFSASPHQWIIRQRLDRAKIMLSSTNRTVSEIGAECGFSNISHFIKLFKQQYGRTPATYRRLNTALSPSTEYRKAVGE